MTFDGRVDAVDFRDVQSQSDDHRSLRLRASSERVNARDYIIEMRPQGM